MKWALIFIAAAAATSLGAETSPQTDSIPLDGGVLRITFIGHGTLMLDWNGKTIHVDPVSREADYKSLPKADLVLITHQHGDHLDPTAISQISTKGTIIVANKASTDDLDGAQILGNGEKTTVYGIPIEAVPAYNTTKDRQKFHPPGRDNGYILSFGDDRVYIAGDTEDTPEMKALQDIAIAFLPMNQPYTMIPEQAAAAARAFQPKILYPYHFGNTDPNELVALLKDFPAIEVRIRELD